MENIRKNDVAWQKKYILYIHIYIYQALPATLLGKLQNRMQRKISNDACSHENDQEW